ncbi:MAG: DUF2809 domain-containing protein [Flavobacteriaceae bacterium]|nr:DUF2809 domain-containing protein [Flavobacteriaceae bacterium]
MKPSFTFHYKYFIAFMIFLIIEIAIALCFKTGFIRYTLGDYLVVMLLYCGIKSVINIKPMPASILVLCIAYNIEILQFFNILKPLGLESNTFAKLILGSTFHFEDIIAYTLGILTLLFLEHKYNQLACKP